jgi:hypothetical protein
MAAPIERFNTKLPAGFDPAVHGSLLIKHISKTHGDGWIMESVDMGAGVAVMTRQSTVTHVTKTANKDVREVTLRSDAKPADGDKYSIRLADQANEDDSRGGWEMTRYDPYLRKAVLSRLTPEEIRCRGVLAVAMGAKAWEVQVKGTSDGGFIVELPNTYVPSKHDAKIDEAVVTAIGRDGWYVNTDAQARTLQIVPAEPPTFNPAVPYPFGTQLPVNPPKDFWARIPIGEKLGGHGTRGGVLDIDLLAAPHTQLSGTSGAGKSVTLNAIIAGALARDFELAIIDVPAKSVDFMWMKQWVRDGGWGCDSIKHGATAMAMIYEEGQRRAEVLKNAGVTKWTDLDNPASYGIRPILVIVDEITGLLVANKPPAGISKQHPIYIEIMEDNLDRALIGQYIGKIGAELRFVGVHLIASSQVASTLTGMTTPMRMNLANKILLGTKPTDSNRNLALQDAGSVPYVPANIQNDPTPLVSKGVGVYEFEAQVPGVFKSFYASTSQFHQWLSTLGLPVTDSPSPTDADIRKHIPSL